jgi:hypothetical protein
LTVSLFKVSHELVFTDTTAWHSGGISGIQVHATRALAERAMRRIQERRPEYRERGRFGLFIRKALRPVTVTHEWRSGLLWVIVNAPNSEFDRAPEFARKEAHKIARERGNGGRPTRISVGGTFGPDEFELRVCYSLKPKGGQ